MSNIKIYNNIDLDKPVMLAAWPGTGDVAMMAVDYIRKKLNAIKFAEIEHDMYIAADAVVVNDGIAALQEIPNSPLYYTENPPLIIFEGMFQLDGMPGMQVISDLLDLAQRLHVEQIYTCGAFSANMRYSEPSVVFAAANRELLKKSFNTIDVELLSNGKISGMNGTLIGHARNRGMDAICFLASMPVYAAGFVNPKAAKALVEIFKKILGAEIDTSDLDSYISKAGKTIEYIEEHIRTQIPGILPEEDKQVIELKENIQQAENPHEKKQAVNLKEDELPSCVMKKIEKLFQEAEKDCNKTGQLRQELNRWNLFDLYEDRFLNLFRKGH